ncbi:MAG: hypothetical protein GY898_27410 [Proteobacteria bacterium]|nr:hypothetical protein [Pseudomonadota bacterium]
MPTSTRSYTDLPAPAPPAAALRKEMAKVMCPECASRYRFPVRKLSDGHGLKVTCPKCQHQFVAVAPKPVSPTVPFPAIAGVDNNILDVWMHGQQQRRHRRVLGVVAALLLAGAWGFFSGSDDVEVETAPIMAEVPTASSSAASTEVSAAVAAILEHDSTALAAEPTEPEPEPAAKAAPAPVTASVLPHRAPKPAAGAAPKPPALSGSKAPTPQPKTVATVAPKPATKAAPKAVTETQRAAAGMHWYSSAMDAKSAGNGALAEKMMQRAVAKAPTRGDWWAELATLQRDLGKAEDAEVSSRRAFYLSANAK